VATTDRGIYYTDGGNDGDVADLNVITKAMADSTEAALDVLDSEKLDAAGGTMSGNLNMGGNYLLNVKPSGAPGDAATVGQVNAVAAAIPKGGRTLVTFDGSGNGTIAHGFGSAPTWAQLTAESPYSVFGHVVSITSTVLNVRASSTDVGIIVSDSVWMHWLVGV